MPIAWNPNQYFEFRWQLLSPWHSAYISSHGRSVSHPICGPHEGVSLRGGLYNFKAAAGVVVCSNLATSNLHHKVQQQQLQQ